MYYDWAVAQPDPPQPTIDRALRELALAANYAHIAGVGDETWDPQGFTRENNANASFEAVLTRPDSNPLPLMTDDEIWQRILNELAGCEDRPNTCDRYWARFPTPEDKPLRRFGDHYEAVGLDGEFHEIPNISHQWFGGVHLWDSLPMCALGPTVLDCSWALLGCERPDLDGSGIVDAADQALFDTAWATYGSGASCDAGNAWCDGADLDRGGVLDGDDQAFMAAAQGCWY
jgi:hypothetical protein